MNKFIVAIMFLFAPGLAVADTLGCAAGALIGGAIGAQIGGGATPVILATLGGLGGCSAGSRIEDGTYGVNNQPVVTRTITVVNSDGSGYTRPALQSSSNPCPGHWERSYFMQEGTRRNPGSGGITSEGCGGGQRVQNVNNAVYTITTTTENTPRVRKSSGITVDNYSESRAIFRGCKHGNSGKDGLCLLEAAEVLMLRQMDCDGKIKAAEKNKFRMKGVDVECPVGYNAGEWAENYRVLGNELIAKQKALQGGREFVLER